MLWTAGRCRKKNGVRLYSNSPQSRERGPGGVAESGAFDTRAKDRFGVRTDAIKRSSERYIPTYTKPSGRPRATCRKKTRSTDSAIHENVLDM